MRTRRLAVIILSVIAFFCSCTKDLDNLPGYKEQLSAEGYIEAGKHPYVILTKTIPLSVVFDPDSFPPEYIVHNAIVTISDGTFTDTLRELYPDWLKGMYLTDSMIGEEGKQYVLRVDAEGKVLTSTTYIPYKVNFDSLWFLPYEAGDSLGYIYARFNDPPGVQNFYSIQAKSVQRDWDFVNLYNNSFNDELFAGQTFTFFFDRDDQLLFNRNGLFMKGDTAVAKFTGTTRDYYLFKQSLQNQTPNPFSQNDRLYSNITGGVGIWSGLNTVYDTLVVE